MRPMNSRYGNPFSFVLMALVFAQCSEDVTFPEEVEWTFHLNDSTHFSVPGTFSDQTMGFCNGPDVLTAQWSAVDSAYILAAFDGHFSGSWSDGEFSGFWWDRLRGGEYKIQLSGRLEANQAKWVTGQSASAPPTSWKFYLPATDSVPMGTLFLHESASFIQGTIATPTGDLRYLTGSVNPSGVWELGTFDGAHLYQLVGQKIGSQWMGVFYSGNHYSGEFRAEPFTDEAVLLPNSASLLKGVPFSMKYLSPEGDSLVLTLDQLPAEVTVIDLIGTWCPNCLDEIQLLKQLQEDYPSVGFLSAAFERQTEPSRAYQRIEQYRQALSIPWEVVLCGPANKSEAQSCFPMLSQVKSFPTTLFIHRDGRMIAHSGFNGPATGSAYEAEVAVFKKHIDSLLTQP